MFELFSLVDILVEKFRLDYDNKTSLLMQVLEQMPRVILSLDTHVERGLHWSYLISFTILDSLSFRYLIYYLVEDQIDEC